MTLWSSFCFPASSDEISSHLGNWGYLLSSNTTIFSWKSSDSSWSSLATLSSSFSSTTSIFSSSSRTVGTMGEETPFSLSSVPCLLPSNWVLNAVFLSFCVRCPLSDVKVSIRSWSSSLSDWTFWSWLLCWSTTFTGPSLTKALVLLLLTEDRKTLLTLRPYSSEYSTSSSEVSVGTSTANSNEGSRRSSLATLLVVVIFEIIVTRRPCSSM